MAVAISASVLFAQTTPAAYPLKGPSNPVTRNAPLPPEVARTLDPKKIITFGAIYTPFIRTALLAGKATPSEIQDSLTYVAALPWQRTDVTGPERLVDAEYVIVTPHGSTERTQTIQPVWVKTDTSLLRSVLGPTVPARAMLAAFSPDAIQAGRDFVIVYGGAAVYAQRVEIRAEDIASWK